MNDKKNTIKTQYCRDLIFHQLCALNDANPRGDNKDAWRASSTSIHLVDIFRLFLDQGKDK